MSATDLKQRLLAWIANDPHAFASFDEAAHAVFAHQYAANASYRRYCDALARSPATLDSWRAIPALPTDAFKLTQFPLRCFSADEVKATFLTSGTTRDIRGAHQFDDLTVYETSILAGWKPWHQPAAHEPWFLSASPATQPNSSLVHMFATLQRKLAPQAADRWLIDAEGKIEHDRLRGAVSNGKPVFLFSTALALLRWMDSSPPTPLPKGSAIFETGGYKGLNIELNPDAFHVRLIEHFGIARADIVNEYSMTELSSQWYRRGDQAEHHGPHWTRIRVIDPETQQAAAPGAPGYLELIDLANLGSVAAIRTQDIAVATGDSSFILLGRDPGALPRGCSRAADDLISSNA